MGYTRLASLSFPTANGNEPSPEHCYSQAILFRQASEIHAFVEYISNLLLTRREIQFSQLNISLCDLFSSMVRTQWVKIDALSSGLNCNN